MLTVANHPNRGKGPRAPGANPTPAQIRAAREVVGLTQTQAADLVYATLRSWQNWESEDPAESRRMHPAIFEYFLVLTGQMPLKEALGARKAAERQ